MYAWVNIMHGFSLFRLVIPLVVMVGFSSNAIAVTVDDFINFKAMLMSADDQKSPLTQEERKKIRSLEILSNQQLSGIIEGAISLNDISTLKGNSKLICYPAGKAFDIKKFSDGLVDYYDHFEPSKRAFLSSQRLGDFATAFLMKSYPCK